MLATPNREQLELWLKVLHAVMGAPTGALLGRVSAIIQDRHNEALIEAQLCSQGYAAANVLLDRIKKSCT